MKVLVVPDIHLKPEMFNKAAALFDNTKAQAIVVLGDIVDDFGICMECKANKTNPEDYGVIGDIVRLTVDDKYLDEKGKVDLAKLQIIAYDPFNHGYFVVEKKVGQAFSDGRKYIK